MEQGVEDPGFVANTVHTTRLGRRNAYKHQHTAVLETFLAI